MEEVKLKDDEGVSSDTILTSTIYESNGIGAIRAWVHYTTFTVHSFLAHNTNILDSLWPPFVYSSVHRRLPQIV